MQTDQEEYIAYMGGWNDAIAILLLIEKGFTLPQIKKTMGILKLGIVSLCTFTLKDLLNSLEKREKRMLSQMTIERLIANWPYAADMATFVEARIYDPASIAEWYLIALDPEDSNRACAIVVTDTVEMDYVDINELIAMFEAMGKELIFDENFRREKCLKIWSKLMRKMRGEFNATI